MNKHNTKYAGIDLGDKTSMIQILDQEGELVEETRLPTTERALERKFGNRDSMKIAIEVGTHSRWVSRKLKGGYGHEVIVANARALRLIYKNPRKSDRVDAAYLAKLVRLDQSLLGPIRHCGEAVQKHLAILRSRDSLVKARTKLINHIRGMVKSYGARLPGCSTESFVKKARPVLPIVLRPALEPVLESIEELNKHISSYQKEIERLADEEYPETKSMCEIKGVGALTALTFVLTLEDPGRFVNSRDVGPCLGLVPKRDQSGEHDPERHITKTGDTYLRNLLVGSAHYILGPYGQDSRLRRWGLKLAERGGKNAKKRAVVAVARKLGVLLHKLWVSGEEYDPFYGSQEQPVAMEEAVI
jgi:transposase